METAIPTSCDDPQFVKVLDTCLRMEIANAQENFEANVAEMKRLKETIRTEVNKRKQLKTRVAQMDRVRTILSECLTRLRASISETSDTLEAMKANVDDEYKLMQLKTQEYQNLLAEYKKTWHAYRAMYEEFPLAKERRTTKSTLEKRKIEYMVMTYKKKELTTIIKQRRQIDWIRTRCKIVEFGSAIVERLKLEEKLTNLEVDVNHHRRELRSIEAELQMLRKQEEDQERMRRQKILEMAPPKINIPYRNMYNHNRMHARVQTKQFHETYDVDSISINTLILEQLCVNENATALPDNVELMQVDNAESTIMETESANLQNNTAVSEKIDIPVASMDVEANAEKAALMDNDVEMKESHREERSQESVKAQPCCRTKENSLKHSGPKNTQDEIEAKRIRLQKEDSAESSNKMSAPPPVVIEEIDLTSPVPVPRIRKIEMVHYNVTAIKSKNVHVNALSPVYNEYCESNMSSFDQDFISKDNPSLFEESLCNYRLSPNSNISPMCMTEDAQISPSRYQNTLQDVNKIQSGDNNTSAFQFDNFIKKTEKDDFTLF